MANRPLQPYHVAWLEAHPYRTEAWLRERMADGFDVHHLDGDKSNNASLNLVLIESGDHLMLHNGSPRRICRIGPRKGRRGPNKRRVKVKVVVETRVIEVPVPVAAVPEPQPESLPHWEEQTISSGPTARKPLGDPWRAYREAQKRVAWALQETPVDLPAYNPWGLR